MAKRIFVGRQQELKEFEEALRKPEGQAILVVGQAGMGKSWLIEEMVARAESGTLFQCEPGPECWAMSYEIRPTDSVNRIVEQIVTDACEAAQPIRQKLGMTGDKKDKWRALFGAAGLMPVLGPKFKQLGDLLLSCSRAPIRDTRDAFVKAMRKMSECLLEGQRVLFIVDPDKTMPVGSDHLWRSVIQELPDRIKLIFAQRPSDVLVNNLEFCSLPNVVLLPRQKDQLDGLKEGAIKELTDLYARMTTLSGTTLRDAVSRYKGHAYSTTAALELLRRGTKAEMLPKDPQGIAASQWKEVRKVGPQAIRMFKAYAILSVPVPEEVARAVGDLDPDTWQSLTAHDYLGGLLRKEDGNRAIYHAILADHVVDRIDGQERRTYHHRAAEVYRARLRAESQPDALAAERLPEHVLESGDKAAFIDTIVNVCTEPLIYLGRFDTLIRLSGDAMRLVEEDSDAWAVVASNLGVAYQTHGCLDQAEEMHRQLLEIEKRLGRLTGVANDYGNLGIVLFTRGNFFDAEQMLLEALRTYEGLGQLDGMARQYVNLGLTYRVQRYRDLAAQMYRRAAEIYGKLGQFELMAYQYRELGDIYRSDEDFAAAHECWHKALELFQKIGMLDMVERTQRLLAHLESEDKD